MGNKTVIVFVKLFGFDSDLYLIVEGRVLCIEGRSLWGGSRETVIGEAERWPPRDPYCPQSHLVVRYQLRAG